MTDDRIRTDFAALIACKKAEQREWETRSYLYVFLCRFGFCLFSVALQRSPEGIFLSRRWWFWQFLSWKFYSFSLSRLFISISFRGWMWRSRLPTIRLIFKCKRKNNFFGCVTARMHRWLLLRYANPSAMVLFMPFPLTVPSVDATNHMPHTFEAHPNDRISVANDKNRSCLQMFCICPTRIHSPNSEKRHIFV